MDEGWGWGWGIDEEDSRRERMILLARLARLDMSECVDVGM